MIGPDSRIPSITRIAMSGLINDDIDWCKVDATFTDIDTDAPTMIVDIHLFNGEKLVHTESLSDDADWNLLECVKTEASGRFPHGLDNVTMRATVNRSKYGELIYMARIWKR